MHLESAVSPEKTPNRVPLEPVNTLRSSVSLSAKDTSILSSLTIVTNGMNRQVLSFPAHQMLSKSIIIDSTEDSVQTIRSTLPPFSNNVFDELKKNINNSANVTTDIEYGALTSDGVKNVFLGEEPFLHFDCQSAIKKSNSTDSFTEIISRISPLLNLKRSQESVEPPTNLFMSCITSVDDLRKKSSAIVLGEDVTSIMQMTFCQPTSSCSYRNCFSESGHPDECSGHNVYMNSIKEAVCSDGEKHEKGLTTLTNALVTEFLPPDDQVTRFDILSKCINIALALKPENTNIPAMNHEVCTANSIDIVSSVFERFRYCNDQCNSIYFKKPTDNSISTFQCQSCRCSTGQIVQTLNDSEHASHVGDRLQLQFKSDGNIGLMKNLNPSVCLSASSVMDFYPSISVLNEYTKNSLPTNSNYLDLLVPESVITCDGTTHDLNLSEILNKKDATTNTESEIIPKLDTISVIDHGYIKNTDLKVNKSSVCGIPDNNQCLFTHLIFEKESEQLIADNCCKSNESLCGQSKSIDDEHLVGQIYESNNCRNKYECKKDLNPQYHMALVHCHEQVLEDEEILAGSLLTGYPICELNEHTTCKQFGSLVNTESSSNVASIFIFNMLQTSSGEMSSTKESKNNEISPIENSSIVARDSNITVKDSKLLTSLNTSNVQFGSIKEISANANMFPYAECRKNLLISDITAECNILCEMTSDADTALLLCNNIVSGSQSNFLNEVAGSIISFQAREAATNEVVTSMMPNVVSVQKSKWCTNILKAVIKPDVADRLSCESKTSAGCSSFLVSRHNEFSLSNTLPPLQKLKPMTSLKVETSIKSHVKKLPSVSEVYRISDVVYAEKSSEHYSDLKGPSSSAFVADHNETILSSSSSKEETLQSSVQFQRSEASCVTSPTGPGGYKGNSCITGKVTNITMNDNSSNEFRMIFDDFEPIIYSRPFSDRIRDLNVPCMTKIGIPPLKRVRTSSKIFKNISCDEADNASKINISSPIQCNSALNQSCDNLPYQNRISVDKILSSVISLSDDSTSCTFKPSAVSPFVFERFNMFTSGETNSNYLQNDYTSNVTVPLISNTSTSFTSINQVTNEIFSLAQHATHHKSVNTSRPAVHSNTLEWTDARPVHSIKRANLIKKQKFDEEIFPESYEFTQQKKILSKNIEHWKAGCMLEDHLQSNCSIYSSTDTYNYSDKIYNKLSCYQGQHNPVWTPHIPVEYNKNSDKLGGQTLMMSVSKASSNCVSFRPQTEIGQFNDIPNRKAIYNHAIEPELLTNNKNFWMERKSPSEIQSAERINISSANLCFATDMKTVVNHDMPSWRFSGSDMDHCHSSKDGFPLSFLGSSSVSSCIEQESFIADNFSLPLSVSANGVLLEKPAFSNANFLFHELSAVTSASNAFSFSLLGSSCKVTKFNCNTHSNRTQFSTPSIKSVQAAEALFKYTDAVPVSTASVNRLQSCAPIHVKLRDPFVESFNSKKYERNHSNQGFNTAISTFAKSSDCFISGDSALNIPCVTWCHGNEQPCRTTSFSAHTNTGYHGSSKFPTITLGSDYSRTYLNVNNSCNQRTLNSTLLISPPLHHPPQYELQNNTGILKYDSTFSLPSLQFPPILNFVHPSFDSRLVNLTATDSTISRTNYICDNLPKSDHLRPIMKLPHYDRHNLICSQVPSKFVTKKLTKSCNKSCRTQNNASGTLFDSRMTVPYFRNFSSAETISTDIPTYFSPHSFGNAIPDHDANFELQHIENETSGNPLMFLPTKEHNKNLSFVYIPSSLVGTSFSQEVSNSNPTTVLPHIQNFGLDNSISDLNSSTASRNGIPTMPLKFPLLPHTSTLSTDARPISLETTSLDLHQQMHHVHVPPCSKSFIFGTNSLHHHQQDQIFPLSESRTIFSNSVVQPNLVHNMSISNILGNQI